MTKTAIMQPTFLPWCGYFALIDHVDKFIFLDSVQFSRRSWQQRNQIKTATGTSWLSVPVYSKGRRDQNIFEVEIDLSRDFPRNQIRTIELNYHKTPYFNDFSPELFTILSSGHQKLSELTMELIQWICLKLNISTPLIRASDLSPIGVKAELLASLCHQVNATLYVSPPGSKVYLDESNALNRANIKLSYFHYDHPIYPQPYGDFLSHMSILDLILNCGNDSRKVLLSGKS
jgi:hypothetical protein